MEALKHEVERLPPVRVRPQDSSKRIRELDELIKGDTTRARSEWRMAFRQDPSHVRARARLNI